jgi:hypothetical protein
MSDAVRSSRQWEGILLPNAKQHINYVNAREGMPCLVSTSSRQTLFIGGWQRNGP